MTPTRNKRITQARWVLRPPGWLGWAAAGFTIVTGGLALIPLSIWAYRRGRREGAELEEGIDAPLPNFGWAVVGWTLALFIPLFGWVAVVHLPTMCYKHGASVGYHEKYAGEGFTSALALVTALVGAIVLVWGAIVPSAIAAYNDGIDTLGSRREADWTPLPPNSALFRAVYYIGPSHILPADEFQVVLENMDNTWAACDVEVTVKLFDARGYLIGSETILTEPFLGPGDSLEEFVPFLETDWIDYEPWVKWEWC